LGRYNGPVQILKTLQINASLGFSAIACCIAILFVDSLGPIMTLIWLLLFSGGATVPSLTGIIVSSVDPSLRSFASSLSQLSFNILGFALSTLVPAAVMEITGSRDWGFSTVVLWSLWGVPATVLGLSAAHDNLNVMRNVGGEKGVLRLSCCCLPDLPGVSVLSENDSGDEPDRVNRVEVKSIQASAEEGTLEKELTRFPVTPLLGEMMIPVQFGINDDDDDCGSN
jgi:hypothetical protein